MAMRLMKTAMSGSRMALRTITTAAETTTAPEAKSVRPKPRTRTRTIPKPKTTGTPETDLYPTSEEYDLAEKEADRIEDQALEEAKKQFPEAFVDDGKAWSFRDTRHVIY